MTETLNELEKDEAVDILNRSTLSQSVVIIWSVTESLIRDVIKERLNSDRSLAIDFFKSNETNPYWQRKQLTIEHLEEFGFDLTEKLGDVALSINACNSLAPMKSAFEFVLGKNSESYSALKSPGFYKLYKLRNVIAHRNGMVGRKV